MVAIGDSFKHKSSWDDQTDDFAIYTITGVGGDYVTFASGGGADLRVPLEADQDTTWGGLDAELVAEWVSGPTP